MIFCGSFCGLTTFFVVYHILEQACLSYHNCNHKKTNFCDTKVAKLFQCCGYSYFFAAVAKYCFKPSFIC